MLRALHAPALLVRALLRRPPRNAALARRLFSAPATPSEPLTAENSVAVNWTRGDGQQIAVRGRIGESLLDLARREDIELEGACEGSIACSTCHVILESRVFDALPEATDEENDMLDLAFGLTQTCVADCALRRVRTSNFEFISLSRSYLTHTGRASGVSAN